MKLANMEHDIDSTITGPINNLHRKPQQKNTFLVGKIGREIVVDSPFAPIFHEE